MHLRGLFSVRRILAPSLCFAGFPCVTPHNELVKSYKSVGCVPPRLKFLFRTFDRLSYIYQCHSIHVKQKTPRDRIRFQVLMFFITSLNLCVRTVSAQENFSYDDVHRKQQVVHRNVLPNIRQFYQKMRPGGFLTQKIPKTSQLITSLSSTIQSFVTKAFLSS